MAFTITEIDRPAALQGQPNGSLPHELLVETPGQAGGPTVTLEATAALSWRAMCAAAPMSLRATSEVDSYRPYSVQERVFRERYSRDKAPGAIESKQWKGSTWWLIPGNATAATPGRSNHGLALAVDVHDAEGERLDWLVANAGRFGWSWELQREPWHLHYWAGDNPPPAVLQEDDMTPEQAAQLAEVHKLLTTGQRTGAANITPASDNQTTGGGVPIAWLPKQFHQIDSDKDQLLAVISELSPGPGQPVDVDALATALALHLGLDDAAKTATAVADNLAARRRA